MFSMPSFFNRSARAERLFCWSSCSRLDLDQQLLELLLGRAPIGTLDGDALADLAGKAGDPHHEEFVEIGRRDRQEAHPFEQRMVRVLRFLQHAAVELQPGELAVDEAVRIADHHSVWEPLTNSFWTGFSSFIASPSLRTKIANGSRSVISSSQGFATV